MEGTGSYGAGLTRHVTAAGVRVAGLHQVRPPGPPAAGQSDPLDAVSAARAAQSGRARGAPKGRDGTVEAIRALMVAKRSATGERTRTINQARALVLTGPDDLRARFAKHTAAALVAATALAAAPPRRRRRLRRPHRAAGAGTARGVPRRPARAPRRAHRSPRDSARPRPARPLRDRPGTAALLLIAAGDHPERLRSEAAWAHLCAAAPIPASSGKTVRHRLNPGGDRQADHALWRERVHPHGL